MTSLYFPFNLQVNLMLQNSILNCHWISAMKSSDLNVCVCYINRLTFLTFIYVVLCNCNFCEVCQSFARLVFRELLIFSCNWKHLHRSGIICFSKVWNNSPLFSWCFDFFYIMKYAHNKSLMHTFIPKLNIIEAPFFFFFNCISILRDNLELIF